MPHWSKKWGRDKICPITHTRLRPGKNKRGVKYVIELVCGHMFYRSAVLNYIRSCENPVCPMCRHRIVEKKIL